MPEGGEGFTPDVKPAQPAAPRAEARRMDPNALGSIANLDILRVGFLNSGQREEVTIVPIRPSPEKRQDIPQLEMSYGKVGQDGRIELQNYASYGEPEPVFSIPVESLFGVDVAQLTESQVQAIGSTMSRMIQEGKSYQQIVDQLAAIDRQLMRPNVSPEVEQEARSKIKTLFNFPDAELPHQT